MMRTVNCLLIALCVMVLAGYCAADSVITGVNAMSSANWGDRFAVDAVNGNGLTGELHNIAGGDMWLEYITPGIPGATTGKAWMDVDLGGWYSISEIDVWNYNESGPAPNHTHYLDVEFWNGTGFDAMSTMTLAGGTGAPLGPTNFSVSQAAARYARVRVENFSDPTNYGGLSELRFTGASVSAPVIAPDPYFIIDGSTITATASSEFGGRGAAETLDGIGLTYTKGHVYAPESQWMTAVGNTTGWIAYDLGEIKNLAEIDIWNYNEGNATNGLARSAKTVDVQLSNDGSAWTTLTTLSLAMSPGSTDFLDAVSVDLTGNSARHIRLNITENWGDSVVTGIGAVEIYEVPEPVTMVLLGLGSLCLIRRKRG